MFPLSASAPEILCVLFIPEELTLSFLQYVVFKVRAVSYILQPTYSLLLLCLIPSGDGEIRTLDPLLARQVLSQLSYTPTDAGLPSFEAIPCFVFYFFVFPLT